MSKKLFSLLEKRPCYLIFFDTETTGLHSRFKVSQITQIAAVVYHMDENFQFKKIEEYSAHSKLNEAVQKAVNLGKNQELLKVLKMTDYDSLDQSTAVTEKELLQGFLEFTNQFKSHPVYLLAHNAPFDARQITDAAIIRNKSLSKPVKELFKSNKVIDTKLIASGILHPVLIERKDKNEKAKKILNRLTDENNKFRKRLVYLGEAFEISNSFSHNALNDANQLAGVTMAMIDFILE